MPVDPFQHMGDFMRHHVRQQGVREGLSAIEIHEHAGASHSPEVPPNESRPMAEMRHSNPPTERLSST